MVTRFTGDFESHQDSLFKRWIWLCDLKNNEVIAGISSGLVYREAVEGSQLDQTNKEMDLPKKFGAAIFLESLNRDMLFTLGCS